MLFTNIKNYITQFPQLLKSHLYFYRSRQIEDEMVESVKTACLVLGPYRNLTTLTAGIVFLHPFCQVLNHAAKRIFPIKNANFLINYSEAKFENFIKYAIYYSRVVQRDGYGGSITMSHAFDHPIMKETYQRRYGDSLIKREIQSLFWKESMHVSNLIKQNNVNVMDLLDQNKKLRFFMPIRNPLDCAISNFQKGYAEASFLSIKDYSLPNILESILEEISWFLDLHKENPDKFFFFFENDFDRGVLLRIAEFLDIEPIDEWIKDSLDCYQIRKAYEYEPELIDTYHRLIKVHFGYHPLILEKMEKFSKTA
ncbi:hypothetical protein ACFL6B_00010 [Thermodesulfobacteriota bacterium]